MRLHIRNILYLVCCALLLLTPPASIDAAPFPNPSADDNGQEGFVRQVVPLLLGRRARGMTEIEVLSRVANSYGRETLVRVLMEDPEFAAHWSDVLLDTLRLQRDSGRAQARECFEEPMRDNSDATLAAWIRSNPADGGAAPGGAFNMADVILSSIKLDDLTSIYQTYLFPLAMQIGRGGRRVVGSAFVHDYLNRQLSCLGCHNAEYSISGNGSAAGGPNNDIIWNRTHPLPYALDTAMFGAPYGPNSELAVFNLFRDDARNELTQAQIDDPNASDDDRIDPWELHESCIEKEITGDNDMVIAAWRGFNHPNAGGSVNFAGLNGNTYSVFDLAALVAQGKTQLNAEGVLPLPPPQPGALPELDPAPALAYTIAATAVNNVWEAVMGKKLTITNYFPRNEDQRDALWHLTEDVFIQNNWSLKELLVRILTTHWVNRRAPDVGTAAQAYTLPMVIDPWVEADPRQVDPLAPIDVSAHFNGQGEIVRRHLPRTILYSTSTALNWQRPQLFPTDDAFPQRQLVLDIGQFTSQNNTGTDGVDFQSLLAWEAAIGRCENKNSGAQQDWIDRVMAQASAFNATNPNFQLTVSDLIQTVKDWLIQNAAIEQGVVPEGSGMVSEDVALAASFGPLHQLISDINSTTLERQLRDYCGILLRSPQFLLTGIEPSGPSPKPRLRVCNHVPCSKEQICNTMNSRLQLMGIVAPDICDTGANFCQLNPDVCNFCPQGQCGHMVAEGFDDCLLNPQGCRARMPRCDPLCLGAGCCGGPYPVDWRSDLIFLGYWEQADVAVAENVLIRPMAENEFKPLTAGTQLKFGDVLVLDPGAELKVKSRGGGFTTPRGGMRPRAMMTNSPIDEAMLDAAVRGRTRTIEALVRKGASVHAQDAHGRTPLILAVENKQRDVARLLLKLDADVLHRDGRGVTALAIAQLTDQTDMVALLERAGAFLTREERSLRALPKPRAVPWIMLVTGPSRVKARAFTRDNRMHAFQIAEIVNKHAKYRRDLPYQELRKQYLERLVKFNAASQSPPGSELKAFNENLRKYGPVDGVW